MTGKNNVPLPEQSSRESHRVTVHTQKKEYTCVSETGRDVYHHVDATPGNGTKVALVAGQSRKHVSTWQRLTPRSS